MSRAWLVVLAVATATMGTAQTPGVCPWLNAGTAAKALGGEVTVTAATSSPWKGTCRFVARSGSVQIAVGDRGKQACGADATALDGIGNQAVRCSRRDAGGGAVETVEGRVRDAWFVVELAGGSRRRSGAQGGNSARAAIVFLAEQVAGNLY